MSATGAAAFALHYHYPIAIDVVDFVAVMVVECLLRLNFSPAMQIYFYSSMTWEFVCPAAAAAVVVAGVGAVAVAAAVAIAVDADGIVVGPNYAVTLSVREYAEIVTYCRKV